MKKILMLCCCMLLAAAQAQPPKKLLYLSFDSPDRMLNFSRSDSTVQCVKPVLMVGKRGNGIKIANSGNCLQLAAAGNINYDRGTISFWLKPLFLSGGEKSHVLVSIGKFALKNPQALRLWFWGFKNKNILRLDCGSRKNGAYPMYKKIKPGRWYHIAVTWNKDQGSAIWVDGEKVAERSYTWKPKTQSKIVIGGNSKAKLPTDSIIDEFTIYDRPLTADELKLEMSGHLQAPTATAESPTAAGNIKPPEELLCLSFDSPGNLLNFSRSGSKPKCIYPDLVAGKRGKALKVVVPGNQLQIAAPGNMDFKRGTIAFWLKPQFKSGGRKSYTLLSVGNYSKRNPQALRLWFWGFRGQNVLRLDFGSSKKRRYPMYRDIKPNRWSFIAVSWDCKQGTALWVNGRKVDERRFSWHPEPQQTMTVGSDPACKKTANAVFDEFIVYDRPLTVAEMRLAMQGKLPAVKAEVEKKNSERQIKKEIFYASFDKNFTADRAAGKAAPLSEQQLQLTAGIRGRALQLDNTGNIVFSADKNFYTAEGTLSLWIQFNWEPKGNGFVLAKRGAGLQHDIWSLVNGKKIKSQIYMNDFLRIDGSWLALSRQIFKNEWHNYTITWNATAKLRQIYLDGILIENQSYKNPGEVTEMTFGKYNIQGKNGESVSGLDGALDEVRIYNYAMTSAEVLKQFAAVTPVRPFLYDYAVIAGKPQSVRLKWYNYSNKSQTITVTTKILSADKQTVADDSTKLQLAAGSNRFQQQPLTLSKPGIYSLNLYRNDKFIKKYEIIALDSKKLAAGRQIIPRPADNLKNLQMLEDIDCTATAGAAKYRDDGQSKVVDSRLGKYRETEVNEPLNGFAYRLQLQHPGKPHWLEIQYPDDKPRTFTVAVFQEKYGMVDAKGLDTMGIICGGKQPLTHIMQTKRLLFWPDSKNIIVVFFAYKPYKNESGPAVCKIKLYEQHGTLPVLKISKPVHYPERQIGLWQEDPSMEAYAWFNQDTMYDFINLDFWRIKFERTLSYLNYSGQNVWSMLVMDYFGDTGLTAELPVSFMLRQGRIAGWSDVGAVMLNNNHINFYISINSRMSRKNSSISKLFAADLSKDMTAYFAKKTRAVELVNGKTGFYLPRLNPLHPTVQRKYLELVGLYAEKYGRYSYFCGINFISPHKANTGLYFPNLEAGYGDYNTAKFEKDTGVKIPVLAESRDRFKQRYRWIMSHPEVKKRWIEWRTRKVYAFLKKLVAEIKKYNPNASLLLSIRRGYDDKTLYRQWPNFSFYNYMRDCGIDFKLYRNDPDVKISMAVKGNSQRLMVLKSARTSSQGNGRYFEFPVEIPRIIRNSDRRYCMVSYQNLEVLPWEKPKIKNYWWRVGAWFNKGNGPFHYFAIPQPSARYVLEHFTHLMAVAEPDLILHGWWGSPDNGVLSIYQKFYQVYRSIPDVEFIDAPGSQDPVTVRYFNGRENYLYLVNRESYPVKSVVTLPGLKMISNAVTGQVVELNSEQLTVNLKPHELINYKSSVPLNISRVENIVPPDVISELQKKIRQFKAVIDKKKNRQQDVTDAENVYNMLKQAFAVKQYECVHRLLETAPVMKNEEF